MFSDRDTCKNKRTMNELLPFCANNESLQSKECRRRMQESRSGHCKPYIRLIFTLESQKSSKQASFSVAQSVR